LYHAASLATSASTAHTASTVSTASTARATSVTSATGVGLTHPPHRRYKRGCLEFETPCEREPQSKDYIMGSFERLVAGNWVNGGESLALAKQHLRASIFGITEYFLASECLWRYQFGRPVEHSVCDCHAVAAALERQGKSKSAQEGAVHRGSMLRSNVTVSQDALLALQKLETGTAGMVYAYALELFFQRIKVAEEATGMKFICEPGKGKQISTHRKHPESASRQPSPLANPAVAAVDNQPHSPPHDQPHKAAQGQGGAGESGELGSFSPFVSFVLGILVTTLVSATYHKCYKAKDRSAGSAMYSRVHVDEEDEEDAEDVEDEGGEGGVGESSTRPRRVAA